MELTFGIKDKVNNVILVATMASWERQRASQCLHFQVPFFVFKGALGQIIPNSTEFNLNSSNFLCGQFILSIFKPPQKKTGNVLFYSATHSTQSHPNKKKKKITLQPKFTPENMLPKQEDKTFADLRPLSILFWGGGGAGPLASLFRCFSGPLGSGAPGKHEAPTKEEDHHQGPFRTSGERDDEGNEDHHGPHPSYIN